MQPMLRDSLAEGVDVLQTDGFTVVTDLPGNT